jgi:hypothetical protein
MSIDQVYFSLTSHGMLAKAGKFATVPLNYEAYNYYFKAML